MALDLVIVSIHEKGFPQADFYAGCGDMPADEFNACGMAPDDFFTLKRGETLGAAAAKARECWPNAKIIECADDDDEEEDAP